jgi:hypothetical protein
MYQLDYIIPIDLIYYYKIILSRKTVYSSPRLFSLVSFLLFLSPIQLYLYINVYTRLPESFDWTVQNQRFINRYSLLLGGNIAPLELKAF